jgi:hypothetical protein
MFASTENALRKLDFSTLHSGARRHELAGRDAIVHALCIALLQGTKLYRRAIIYCNERYVVS